ncbi:MAG: O-antigen ligase family protein [Phycisphaerales bacterium JB039]
MGRSARDLPAPPRQPKNSETKGPIIQTQPEHPGRPSLRAAAAWLLLGPRVSPERLDRALLPRSTWERWTEWIALAGACLWMAFVCAPMSFVEFAGAPLALASVIRPRATLRALALFFQTPTWWLLLAWAAWRALSLTWSPEPAEGFDQLGAMRWAWSPLLIFPMLRHRRTLICAMVIGFLCANLAQVAHALGVTFDIDWLTFDREPRRNSGWWAAVVGGTMLTAALGLHLPGALLGRGRIRILGLAGSAITLVAILATGTRGAWLAAAGLIAIGAIVAVARAPRALAQVTPKRILIAGACIVLVAAAAWAFAGKAISGRVQETRMEIARAIEGDLSTFTGRRILMARWAGEAMLAHPIRGVGMGGYAAWADARQAAADVPPEQRDVRSHAHNMLLHEGASTGLVGLALFGAIWFAAIRSAFAWTAGALGTYSAGPAFALIGLLLVGATDVVHINAQTAALWLALLSLTPIMRLGSSGSGAPSTGGTGVPPV